MKDRSAPALRCLRNAYSCMSLDRFIAELRERDLLSDRLLAKLRELSDSADPPRSAQSLSKLLVGQKQITQREATEALRAVLLSGVETDAPYTGTIHDALADDVVTLASGDLLEDEGDPGGSSIFAPFLKTAPKKQAPSRSDPTLVESADEKRPDRGNKLAKPTDGSSAIAVSPSDGDLFTAENNGESEASASYKAIGRKKKPIKRKNPWDSPLILVGGGGLVLLLLIGAAVWWLIYWETGDQKLALAKKAMEAGQYSQAIEHYQRFLEIAPRHQQSSSVRVQLVLLKLRKAIEEANYSQALELAKTELAETENEKSFEEATSELRALLPRLAAGLAGEADQAEAGSTAATESITKTNEAIELCNNNKYIPKSLRDEAQLTEIRETLLRVQRRQESAHDLDQTLTAMNEALTSGNPREIYPLYRKLLTNHRDLAKEEGLLDAIKKATSAEQAGIRFVAEEKPAEKTERPTPWLASLALAQRHASGATAAGTTGTACFRVDGAIYGLEAATGRLLWRRHVGFAAAAFPQLLGADVLVADAVHHDLIRLDAATGKLRWRQEIGEAFTEPLVVGERAFGASDSGRLFVVDLSSGTRMGQIEFSKPLRVRPTADRIQKHLYVAADHSTLYSLSLADLSCHNVYYLGHEPGSIQVPPAESLGKLAVLENDGVETCRLHVLSLDEKGAITGQVMEERLNGLAASPPIVDSRRLILVTDRGQIAVYDVGSGQGDNAITRVAAREATGPQPIIRHAAVAGGYVWIGDTQLTKFSVSPTGNRLAVESIENNFAGAAFDHPLKAFGNTLIHMHRPKGMAGAVVAAIDTESGRTLWATDLAIPIASAPIVDEKAGALLVTNTNGYAFRFDEAAIRSRVQDTPLPGQSVPSPLPPITAAVDLGQGRGAFSAPGSDQLLLVDSAQSTRAVQWVKLPKPLACAAARFGDGFLAPLKIGQVLYLGPPDGQPLATPFQPPLQPRSEVDYRPVGIVDGTERRFVITDGREKIYLVAVVDQPEPHLEAVAEGKVDPLPITSPVVVLGDLAIAATEGSRLVRFRLPSLEAAGESTLPADVVWGPFKLGDQAVLSTADGQLHSVGPTGEVAWTVKLEQGDLAGAPLAVEGGFLLAYRKGILERRELADGKVAATLDVTHPLAAGPVSFRGRLVFTAHDGTLLVVDQP